MTYAAIIQMNKWAPKPLESRWLHNIPRLDDLCYDNSNAQVKNGEHWDIGILVSGKDIGIVLRFETGIQKMWEAEKVIKKSFHQGQGEGPDHILNSPEMETTHIIDAGNVKKQVSL